jgi:CubicO group peptidase (beta-lactamase class C family)
MTGLVIAKLAEMGKLALDEKVSRYVDSPGYTDSFSVRELASHLAGVPHRTDERIEAELGDVRDYSDPLDAFWVFSSHPLLFAPGTDFSYSSNGYILLSAVAQEAAGTGYPDLMASLLFEPYGMSATEFDTSFAGQDTEAAYYAEIGDGGRYEPSPAKRDRSFLFGGGGFISTPSDLVKMARATYDENFLSPAMRQELRTPTRLSSGDENPQRYSIGWRVGDIEIDGRTYTTLHHGGETAKASNAYLWVIPDCKAAIAFAANFVPDGYWRLRPVMEQALVSLLDPSNCTAR